MRLKRELEDVDSPTECVMQLSVEAGLCAEPPQGDISLKIKRSFHEKVKEILFAQ